MTGDFQNFPASPFLLPAIDLRGGRVVRLVQGAGDAEIDYDEDPLSVAGRWIECGAECLHIIDLGAAFGEEDSTAVVESIAREHQVPIQTGGGIRDRDRVQRLLDGGVSRVILGTRALQDPEFLDDAIAAHGPSRVVLAIDVADGRVKLSGWTEDSSLDLAGGLDFATTHGARTLLVTAIDRDGTLSGPNLPLVSATFDGARDRGLGIVVAGGIGKVDDIRTVLELKDPALESVVVGRALYEKSVDLPEALALAREYLD
jgi:phosphoribosylformimino-5-aminoimidazole carboxamide ribotide isomerase